ncbi:MAG: hypothetical protein JNK60_05290 [Acidobacteria bacterium]|nr:hypothetical protein [Acidobacteriota bacterium]
MSDEPGPAPERPQPPADNVVCGGCQWSNPRAAEVCEFCRMPLAAPRKAPRPRPAGAQPGTGGATAGAQPEPRLAAPSPEELVGSVTVRLPFAMTPLRIGIGIVLLAALAAAVVLRRNAPKPPEDAFLEMKKLIQRFEKETGGYPPDLSAPERRFGELPAALRTDRWGRRFVYVARKPRIGSAVARTEDGTPLFGACELRSAGPNGKPGDADDLVWLSE